MTALARGLFRVRRGAGQRWSLLVALGLWPMIGLGLFSGPSLWRGALPQLSAVALLVAAVLWTTVRELGRGRPVGRVGPVLAEVELGILLVTATYVAVAATGGPRSFLYPLVYALVSFLMIIPRHRFVAGAWLAAVVGLEVVLTVGTRGDPRLLGFHLTMIGFFAAGNRLVLSGLVRRLRSNHTRRVSEELDKMRQEARDFRLIASQLPPESRAHGRDEEELRMAHAAVQSIHEQLFHTVDLLKTSLGLHSCALLWCEDPDIAAARPIPSLSIKELATNSEMVTEKGTVGGPGLLTSVVTDPKPLRLRALAGKRLPPYYVGPEPVTDLCAVPLSDHGSLRGVLSADRIGDRPFTPDEEAVLVRAAEHLLRVIEHERVFAAVERGKYEQEQFYRASELLGQALTLEDVYQKTFAAIRAIAHYEVAAITSFDGHGRLHEVLAVDTTGAKDDVEHWHELAGRLDGLQFADGPGLVSMAVKNRHYMPVSGGMVDAETIIFSARTRLRRATSLLVLPLLRGDQVLGAIVLAAQAEGRYPEATREMLRVISHQVGVSLQNARLYESMEERATTDGLTGLTNHRAFQERLSQLHALAERTKQRFSIILTDIDHFKSINDTYGHPVGDQVLRRVASLFAGRSRKVDIVARYGGEEFVLVLPDTDGEGAEHFANQLREEVAAMKMTSEHGSFSVTISMGVAEFPTDGNSRHELVERADQALYHCKENGRNRVTRWSNL